MQALPVPDDCAWIDAGLGIKANTGNPTEDTTRPLRTGALLIIALDDEPAYDLPVYKVGLCPSGGLRGINHETYYL